MAFSQTRSESSETVRQASIIRDGVKIQSGLHGDMQRSAETTDPSISSEIGRNNIERNSLSGKFRPARME